ARAPRGRGRADVHRRAARAGPPPVPALPAGRGLARFGPVRRGRREHVGVETGPVAGVAGGPGLVHLDQHHVAVAVERDRLHPLGVARGLTLDPVLLPAARPVGAPARVQRAMQRLIVHPGQHQHLAGVVLLGDSRYQPVGTALQPRGDLRVEPGLASPDPGGLVARAHVPSLTCRGRRLTAGQRTAWPAARSDSFTSPILISPKWNTLAASTASAPAVTAGAKSPARPAPPLAITGTSTTSRTASISSRSNPPRVPSASIEFSRISPAPSSAARRAQSTASRPVPRRPPCVVTSNPLFPPTAASGPRRASTDTTTHCAPNRSATSLSNSGRAIAAMFSDTLSAPARSSRSTSST